MAEHGALRQSGWCRRLYCSNATSVGIDLRPLRRRRCALHEGPERAIQACPEFRRLRIADRRPMSSSQTEFRRSSRPLSRISAPSQQRREDCWCENAGAAVACLCESARSPSSGERCTTPRAGLQRAEEVSPDGPANCRGTAPPNGCCRSRPQERRRETSAIASSSVC